MSGTPSFPTVEDIEPDYLAFMEGYADKHFEDPPEIPKLLRDVFHAGIMTARSLVYKRRLHAEHEAIKARRALNLADLGQELTR